MSMYSQLHVHVGTIVLLPIATCTCTCILNKPSFVYTYNAYYTYLLTAVHHHGDLESALDDALSRNRDLEKQTTSLKSKVRAIASGK